jgi:hypothetical protein
MISYLAGSMAGENHFETLPAERTSRPIMKRTGLERTQQKKKERREARSRNNDFCS